MTSNNISTGQSTILAPPNLGVGVSLKWLVSQAPYLVHESAIAPHITGSGVLPVVQCLEWRRTHTKALLLTH